MVLHHRPLDFHKRAEPAARAVQAALSQGKFWEYHDAIFEKKKFEDADLTAIATDLGLDVAKWKAEYESKEMKELIKKQDKACVAVGASGTPAFFVNGRKLSGAKPFADFEVVIKEELKKAKELVEKDGIARKDVYAHILKNAKKSGGAAADGQLEGVVQNIDIEGSASEGPKTAAATFVIFSDFQ